MNKLVVLIMGQNCEKFIGMCLESVKDADAIVYCDGGSEGEWWENILELEEKTKPTIEIIQNEYNQEDKQMNGKQRNFYLNYLKTNYQNDWALCLDADEVVEDLSKIKELIQTAKPGLYSPKMRHFIGDLGHEDSTVKDHWVLNRLFKISEADDYPEVEHPVLRGNVIGPTDCTTIWHLAYIPNLWDIKRRYDSHMKKSNMHTPEFLKSWYYAHLFGNYPRSQINLVEIPDIILNEFGINKDEFYFSNRGIEFKHPIMVQQWHEHFKPKRVLDLGCGRGPFLFFWKWFINDLRGVEISKWAVEHPLVNGIVLGDCSKEESYIDSDLITAIDLLEHLDDDKLDKTLRLMKKYGKRFLFSIPFIGDPNLTNDKTHKQFRTKKDWISLLNQYGFDVKEAPKEWLFNHQLLIT
jgi:glycosyltransferase involved in cell wall biosynthesis